MQPIATTPPPHPDPRHRRLPSARLRRLVSSLRSPSALLRRLPPALRAATAALLTVTILTGAAYGALGAWTLRYMDRLAPEGEDEVVKGLYLTRQALAAPDQLIALGSSELTFQDEFHAARLFNDKPTGFSLFVIGSGYRQSIHNFLLLAALGKEVEGKRIVLFVSPTWFQRDITARAYQKNYSPLQAYQFVANAPLSPGLRQRAARRLLQLGSPATGDPLLRNALEAAANPGLTARGKELAAAPFLRASLAHLEFKDRWDVARLLIRKDWAPGPRWRHDGPLDWTRLEQQADADYQRHAGQNQFGMNQTFYRKYVEPKLDQLQGSGAGESWLRSSEYLDLQLVLDELRELKAKPLFISLPVMGQYQDFRGETKPDRERYYARVRQQIREAGFPVADLTAHEYDPGFHNDPWHQGWKGSIAVARIVDDFYHGRLPEAGR